MSGLPYKECTNTSGGCFTAKACLFDCRLEKRDEKMSEAFERVSRERDEHARWRQDLADKLDEVERHRDALGRALNKRENDLMLLRNAVDAMMATLGYHGTISARDDRVQAVMDALAQVDEVER